MIGCRDVAKAPEVGTFIFLLTRFAPDVPVSPYFVSGQGLVYPLFGSLAFQGQEQLVLKPICTSFPLFSALRSVSSGSSIAVVMDTTYSEGFLFNCRDFGVDLLQIWMGCFSKCWDRDGQTLNPLLSAL